jgi:23S rRNA (uracil1939-C5)-methyltransferase
MYKRGAEIELTIGDLAFGGKGICKIETDKGMFTVFVPNTIPGQKVKARVVKAKSRFAECKLLEVVEKAPEEVETGFQAIPGAPYATLPIEIQQEHKLKSSLELFKRIGGVKNVEDLFDEYLESPRIWHYRNKMEYSFSAIHFDIEKNEEIDEFAFGFKHRGTWWAVENMNSDSGLFDEKFENDMKAIRQWLENTGLPPWHPPRREGFFRYLVVRKSFSKDELLMNFVTSSAGLDSFPMEEFLIFIKDLCGERLVGLYHTINDSTGDRVEANAGTMNLLFGEPEVTEQICGLNFEISMTSFFQTNPASAEVLYQKAISYLMESPPKDSVILDLFCGTGTISQLVAMETGCDVVGVDIVESAIENAKVSAKNNGVKSVEFIADDVGKFLLNNPQYTDKIDSIILDPPRAGISPKSLRKIIRLGSRRLVYISCNPATQARDTEILREAGYQLKKLSLCDQFPHTSHVESIALFEK